MKYINEVLNELIDKYENSNHYKRGTSNRKIYKNLYKDYAEYDREIQEEYNKAVLFLKEKNIVDFQFEKGTCEKIIDKVWLNVENIDSAYDLIGRESKSSFVNIRKKIIEDALYKTNTKWIREYFLDNINYINKNKAVKDHLKKDIVFVKGLIKILTRIDIIKDMEPVRVFSFKCFNNSKTFEKQYQSSIISIAKKYEPVINAANSEFKDSKISDNEILAQIGIIAKPELYEFCGNCKVKLKNGIVDFSPLVLGASLISMSVDDIIDVKYSDIKKIIFIENRTNYYQYILNKSKNEFVIFHGGFYSPTKGILFRKFIENTNDIEKYFWGDIDRGGFEMFLRLKENIVDQLKPMNMGITEYYNFVKNGLKRDNKYLKNISKLIEDDKFSIFKDVIEAILIEGKTVEQESFLTD
ncbi:MAG: Wadjet anti-phage system protein JetD domain-containing protein [Lachnospirales bacterium]